MPDVDAVNAPDQALLRADNLVPDVDGALNLRNGSAKLYSSLGDLTATRALRTVELSNGTTYRVAQVGDRIFINGADMGTTFDGTGDIAMGDDGFQIFFARGKTKKKYDGTTWMEWGIPKPEGAVTLSAITAITKSAAAFDSTESPTTNAIEGTSTATTNSAGTANAARILTPDPTTSRCTITRLFTTDQDFLNISGSVGSETDLFDIMVKLQEPSRSQSFKVVFGADNSSTEPFTTDRFEFEFDLRNNSPVDIKDPKTDGFSAYDAAVQAQLDALDPSAITTVKTPTAVKLGITNLGTVGSPKAAARPDAATWFHLSVTRGQFKRFGSTATRGWDTIRGFEVVYKAQDGYTSTATVSAALMIGGGDTSLTGAFKCVIRSARTLDQYTELSPPSNESAIINLNHQTLQITIPAATIANTPDEVDQYWVYLFGGSLDTYYRFLIVSAQPQSGQTIDELTVPVGSDMNDPDKRARITSWGMTMQSGVASADIVATLDQSEISALTENERLEPYQSGPVDNIIAIAGPHLGRMFIMTDDGHIYPSTSRSPSGYNTIEVLDLTKYGDPLWLAKTGAGIQAGMEKDVIFLAGSGDETPDLTSIDLFPQPLNVGNPPIDSSFHVDGNAVIFRSSDGLMVLSGNSLQALDAADTRLLWRGQARHGVSPLNTATGRFRMTVDNLMLYMLAPEGDDVSGPVIYRYTFSSKQWSRLVYPQVAAWTSISKEPSGNLIAGDSTGNVWQLDIGTQDDGNDIIINVLSPHADAGNPLVYKDAFDLQIHAHTGGKTGTVSLYKDGAPLSSFDASFQNTGNTVYRLDASSFGRFLRAQFGFVGSFSTFVLQYFNLTHRVRPPHSVYLDTGYVMAGEPGQAAWFNHVEFDANVASANVTMQVWIDDALSYTTTIDTSLHLNKRFPYVVPVPRGTKGRRPRVVFKTAGSPGEGAVGFDCYSVRLKMRGTGNQTGDQYLRLYPIGESP